MNVNLTAADRRALRTAAQLIENGAEQLKASSTVEHVFRGKAPRLKWDSAAERLIYEREKALASRLRDLAHGISWKVRRG